MVAQLVISALGEVEAGGSQFQVSLDYIVKQQNKHHKQTKIPAKT
jgi:hypothetical protein